MKNINILLLLICLISFCSCLNQNEDSENIPYIHKINITASSIELVEFNTKEKSNMSYVTESLDKFGRVIELKFYNSRNELAYAGSGFYGGQIIRYEYIDGKIIETFFNSLTTLSNDFCCSEAPYRHVYFLNKENKITDIELLYKLDFTWKKESLEKAEKHLKFYQEYQEPKSKLNTVFGYTYSFAKMNGINPTK